MYFKNKKFLIAGVVIILAVVAAVLFLTKPQGIPSGRYSVPYSHPAFGVSFLYPEDWGAYVDEEGLTSVFDGVPLRLAGQDGYLGIDAFGVGIEDDIILENLLVQLIGDIEDPAARHPYGSRPTVKSTVIDGVEALVVLPSSDQPEEANNEALFIGRYPDERRIGDNSFRFFILYAHKNHLENILRTLSFELSREVAD